MPCHRCGARQTDPVKGASPWRRGVRAGEQVLVCPDCQRARDWTADLAHCGACGSARLVRVLGSTQCRDCGAQDRVAPEAAGADDSAVLDPAALDQSALDSAALDQSALDQEGPATEPHRTAATSLSDDVDAALERQFRRGHD